MWFFFCCYLPSASAFGKILHGPKKLLWEAPLELSNSFTKCFALWMKKVEISRGKCNRFLVSVKTRMLKENWKQSTGILLLLLLVVNLLINCFLSIPILEDTENSRNTRIKGRVIRHVLGINQAFYKSSTVGVLNTLFYGSIKIKVLQEKNILGRILLWF